MTTVIDERVVEMRFNNADFEKNVAQSMSTLQKLKEALNFDSAKSLENIGKASKQFDMSNVGNQVDAIQAKFSAMQIVGITAISELTKSAMKLGATLVNKVLGPITSGGMTRAQNLENAKFMLEGIGITWDSIKADIDYGVKDTAYGLDVAAKAAAQLSASGVRLGEDMQAALRGISGVAAMTNKSYEDIADIFTDVAGKGRLQAAELTRLAERGLNASAVLAKALGTTEAGVREMAKKGQIDFATFSKAMDDAFGEHAKDANKTFNGAMSNVRAALSRIGAEFASPYMENMRKIFVDLIPVLNHTKAALEPIINRTKTVMSIIQEAVSKFLTSDGIKTGITKIIDTVTKAFDKLVKAVYLIKVAFDTVFKTSGIGDVFLGIANAIGTFVETVTNLIFTNENLMSLFQFLQGLFSIAKMIIDIFGQVLHALVPVANPLATIFNVAMRLLGILGNLLTFVATFVRENFSLANVLNMLAGVATVVGNALLTIGAAIGGGIIFAIQNFGTVVNFALTKVKEFASFITSKLGGAADAVTNKFNAVTGIISRFTGKSKESTTVAGKMGSAYGKAGSQVGSLGRQTKETTVALEDSQKKMTRLQITIQNIKNFFSTVVKTVVGGIAAIAGGIFTFFTNFSARFQTMSANAKSALDFIKAFFLTIGSFAVDIKDKIAGLFNASGEGSENSLLTKIKNVTSAIAGYIKELGAGRIAALVFAAAMTGLIIAIAKATVSFSTMVVSIRRVFTTIESVIKSKFFTMKQPSLIIQLAQSFAIMAASLVLLSMVPADQLKQTASIMKELLITFAIAAGALRVIDFVISKMGIFSNFKIVNSMLLSLAASLAILVGAFVILNGVTVADDWKTKLIIMGIMFAELAAAAALISKFAPALSGGSLLMLSMALSMKLLVDALAKLGEKDLTEIINNIGAFTALFVGVAMITAAAGRIRLSSALGLLLVAKSLGVILPALATAVDELLPIFEGFRRSADNITTLIDSVRKGLATMFSKINSFFTGLYRMLSETAATVITSIAMIGTVTTLVGGLFGIAAIISAIGSLGNLLKGFAFAVVGVAIAIKIVADTLKELSEYLKTLSDKDYNRLMESLLDITLALTIMVGAVTMIDAVATFVTKNHILDGPTARTNFLGVGIAFVGIGLAINLIAKALHTMQDLPMDKFWSLVGGMSVLLIALGLAAAGTGLITRGGAALVGLAGVMVSMAVFVAAAGIISAMWTPETERGIILAFAGIFTIAMSLFMVLTAMSDLHNAPSILSVMVPTLLMIVTLAGLFAYVGSMEELNTGAIIGAFIGIAVILGEVLVIVGLMAKIQGVGSKAKASLLLAMAAMLTAIAVALVGLAWTIKGTGWAVLGAFALLTLELVAIGGMMYFIMHLKGFGTTLPSRLLLLKTVVGAFVTLALTIAIFSAVVMGVGFGNVLPAMVLLNLQLAAIAGMMWLVMKIKIDGNMASRITLLVLCVAALGAVAIALGALAASVKNNGIANSTAAFQHLAITFGVLGGVMAAVGFVCSMVHEIKQVVAMGVLAAGAVAMIATLTWSLMELSKIDQGDLNHAVQVMYLMIGALTVMTTLFGVLQILLVGLGGFFGAGAGAAVGAFALPALLVALGISVISMAKGLEIGAKAIEILANVITAFIPTLRELEQIDCAKIAVGLVKLGGGMVVAAIGIGAFALAAIAGSVGIGLFALVLSKLSPALETFATSLQTLSGIDIGSIAVDLLALAVAGAALGQATGGVSSFASAIGGLAVALGSYNTASNGGVAASGIKTANWEPIPVEETKKGFKQIEEVAETHTVKMKENNDTLVREYETGTLKRVDAAKDCQEKIVTIEEEGVAKAKDIAETGVDETVEYTINAYGQKIKKADMTGPVKKKAQEVVETAKTTVTTGAKELVSDAKDALKDFNFKGILDGTGLENMFGNLGTICGAIFGQNASMSMADAISKALGNFDWLFKQSGILNKAGKEISQYGANGMDTAAMNAMYKGVASTGSKIFNKNLGDTWSNLHDIFKGMIPTVNDLGTSLEDMGGKGAKAAKNLKESLKDTIENQLDMFSKFEIKTGMTGQQMIENMRSNIDGFASWSHRMAVLAQRFAEAGIDKGLYQKLAEMGPKGYETMNAFYEMSEEQLAEVKDLWATGMTLPESQANIVGQGYEYMGEMAVQGFSNALDDHMAAHEAIHGFTSDVINTAAEDLGVHSPSTVFFEMAYNCLLGFWSGSIENSHWARDAIDFVIKIIIDRAEEDLSYDVFYEYGKYTTLGLAEGMMDEEAIAKLTTSAELLTEIINGIIQKKEEISSPSKLTKRFGNFISQGLAIGMVEAADNVRQAAEYVTDTANETLDYGLSSLQDYADLNTTLLLTPILDMSYLDEQLSGIDETIGVTGQNGGSFSGSPSETSTVNFTQNNYSPKALSRIDIYRQTKNQVSMLKGATG